MTMDRSLASEPTIQESAKLEAAIADYIVEIDCILERMKRTRKNIERLKAETRAMLATIDES
jgi:hypothetical protein